MNNNELYHYGVLGMKWGVRRTEAQLKRARASNYSTQQRQRDRKIYGKGAEKRINDRMLKGESIQSARHNEVERKGRIESGKAIAKTVAKGALVISEAAAVTKLLQKKGFGNSAASDVITDEVIKVGRQVINGIFR